MSIPQKPNPSLILVVDDDRFTRLMLRQIMETEGHQVEEAEDGEQCLAAYTQRQPDMVLLDAMMPVMDGFTCCTQLQALPGGDRTPILMITALNDQASVDWAFAAGATDFVTKPIHPPVLRRRVQRLLEASWAEKALREREQQYRSVVETVKEVIFQTNAAGEWTFLNPAWTALTGFPVEESLGTTLLNYVHPDDRERHQELWRSLIDGQQLSSRQEIRYLTASGQCRWGEIHVDATPSTREQVMGLSGTLQDITERLHAAALEKEKVRLETEIIERRRTEETIRHALEKEKELGELRSRMIATISHEFRTPLTTIQSSSELLENYGEKLPDEKKLRHFQRISNAVQHMSQLLTDVILIGQAEAGQLQFNPAPLDLTRWGVELVEEVELRLEDRHQLTFCSESDESETILDEKLLRQILMTLFLNAIRYSPHGGKLFFDLVCEQGQASFRIQDEGIGIPPQDRERLFEPFYRGSNVGTIQGTGLGLAIAKKCVDLHQGQIQLTSEVGVGTTVTVTLPLSPPPSR